MKNKFAVALIVGIVALGAVIYGIYGLKNSNQAGPEETTLTFFTQWVNYQGNPMVDTIYQNNPMVDSSFSDKVDGIIASFDEGGAYDPILCSQDWPTEIQVESTSYSENDNRALVLTEHMYSGGNIFVEVVLDKDGSDWRISDIICQGDKNEIENLSDENRQLVEEYINDNISSLSPEEAVLGGTFYVTSVRFIGSNSALVDYEDGHIAFTALSEFSVNDNNEVEITSFEIQENISSDFFEVGNIVQNDIYWDIVYEGPGKPALRETLIFSKDSKCLDGTVDAPCFPNFWENGDRIEVEGKMTASGVEVKSFRTIIREEQNISSPEDSDSIPDRLCIDNCGDGVCQEIVCMGEGCPCPESTTTCPQDCE